MMDLLASLAAAAVWLLVFVLTVWHGARLLGLRAAEAIVAGYTAFLALQVLLIRALDLVGILGGTALRAAYMMAAFIGVTLYLRWRNRTDVFAPVTGSADTMDDDKRLVRRIAIGCAAAVLCGVGLFSLVSPVHIWDAMAYHMPMVASYVQNASLDAWPAQDLRQVYRVNAGELQLLNIALLSGTDAWVEVPGVLALGVVLVATFAIARLALRHEALPYVVVLVVLTAPQIVVSATTAKNDLAFTAALLGAFYWAMRAAAEPERRASTHAALAAFSGGVAAGTKVMGLNVLGAAGLLVLVLTLMRRLPWRALALFVVTAAVTFAAIVGPVFWSNLARSAAPVGVAPGEVTFTTGPANLIAAAKYYVFDLAFRRLVVLQHFEHDLSHYGYFFPILLGMGTAAAVLQLVRPRTRRRTVAGLALMAAALFISVIAVRIPIRWDQRFMIWMVPVLAILAGTLIERINVRHALVLAIAAASFALFNLFLILSNEMDGMFTRSAAHLATTGELPRYVDVPPRPYQHMIEGYGVLDRAAAPQDSVLYIGSDDSWMYPAWGAGFTRYVRGVIDESDAAEQTATGEWRFIVIERAASARLRDATLAAANALGYRVLHDGPTRTILQRSG
jgi:hypothetical protein